MRRKIIIRLNDDRYSALQWLMGIYKLTHEDEVYDLAFDQLFAATSALVDKVEQEERDLVRSSNVQND